MLAQLFRFFRLYQRSPPASGTARNGEGFCQRKNKLLDFKTAATESGGIRYNYILNKKQLFINQIGVTRHFNDFDGANLWSLSL